MRVRVRVRVRVRRVHEAENIQNSLAEAVREGQEAGRRKFDVAIGGLERSCRGAAGKRQECLGVLGVHRKTVMLVETWMSAWLARPSRISTRIRFAG